MRGRPDPGSAFDPLWVAESAISGLHYTLAGRAVGIASQLTCDFDVGSAHAWCGFTSFSNLVVYFGHLTAMVLSPLARSGYDAESEIDALTGLGQKQALAVTGGEDQVTCLAERRNL